MNKPEADSPDLVVIGLLGGIASGKSAVAQALADLGAVVLDADQAAHAALADPEVVASLRERWGEAVIDDQGRLVRRLVAERVFGPGDEETSERRFLESLIHPRVRRRLTAQLEELRAASIRVAVLDIPLLLEAGWDAECDVLLFVDSAQSERLARAAKRGWSADEFVWREQAQTPIEEKRRRATVSVANRGSLDDLREQVTAAWAALVRPPSR